MNAPVLPEVLLRTANADPGGGATAPTQPQLALASAGVRRYVWEGRYGPMLIEVEGSEIRVNGQRVEPHRR